MENVAFTLRKFHYMEEHNLIEQKSLFNSRFVECGEELLRICQEKMALAIYDERELAIIEEIRQWVTKDEL